MLRYGLRQFKIGYHTEQCFGHSRKLPVIVHLSKPEGKKWAFPLHSLSNEYGCFLADAEVLRLVNAYRDHGHLKAKLDPLGLKSRSSTYPLEPHNFGLSGDGPFSVINLLHAFPHHEGTLSQIITYLEEMYCGTMSLEVAHVSVCCMHVSQLCNMVCY